MRSTAESNARVKLRIKDYAQYFRMIGFLKPADSRLVRVWACVGASGSGPTKTRNTPSLGAGASTTWNPFLPSASAMISASGRAVATTCQYWPLAGSLRAPPHVRQGARGAEMETAWLLISFAGAGAGGGADCAGLVDSGGVESAGGAALELVADGVVASLGAAEGGVALEESAVWSGLGLFVAGALSRARATSCGPRCSPWRKTRQARSRQSETR